MEAGYFADAAIVGVGATLFMDIWALLLKFAFKVPLANYCLIGRWIGHMPEGTFMHANIAAASQKRAQCSISWAPQPLKRRLRACPPLAAMLATALAGRSPSRAGRRRGQDSRHARRIVVARTPQRSGAIASIGLDSIRGSL